MAPRDDAVVPSSLPGLKYPTYRDDALKSGVLWLKGKQADDGTEGLWRVHDDLYDVSSFVDKHPGGAEWLQLTKGTDITEAFEAHHINPKVEVLLKKFHVRKATTARNSPYSFREDGFYKTLKRRARDVLGDNYSGASWRSILIADGFVAATLLLAVQAAATGSYHLATAAGIFLCYTTIAAHNFFHQKNNFRMYYFDLSLMSSRDWRISHAISHHLYPNTVLDLEISLFEPIFVWRPISKNFIQKYASWIYAPLIYALVFFMEFSKKFRLFVHGHLKYPQKRDFIPLVIPACMYVFGGSSLVDTVLMWLWIVMIGSFLFASIGYNAGHHHPDIFHDGDAPRVDRDWGLGQLDAVRDRKWVSSNLLLVLTNFGNHALHHMFPTVDHDKLYALKGVFQQTCREFGEDFQLAGVWECIQGQFLQLARVKPHARAPK
ncbi:cytochrome b5-related protein-like [Bacillus rossius redtenbacheri]|uniref:cytochrome b5-related protein-like n=1 Tax=Bacillus rossius redtenbacheri TaxID=93214 RepID=UPI002FDE6F42